MTRLRSGSKVIIYFMLNSTEHEFYPLINVKVRTILLLNVKMPTIVGILTFMSRINTTSGSFKQVKIIIFQYFTFYKHLKFHAQLS